MAKSAFRCTGVLRDGSTCGHLVAAEAAGENPVPGACNVCGQGVDHSTGRWLPVAGHWQVLADLSAKDLAKHHAFYGTTDEDIERHSVSEWPAMFAAYAAQSVAVTATDAPGSEDHN